MYFIGFDVGGTKIEIMLIKIGHFNNKSKPILKFEYLKNESEIISAAILTKKRIETERHKGYEQIIVKMEKLFHDVCKEQNIKLADICGVGLSVPGPIHPHTQKIISSNSMIVVGRSLQEDLNNKLNLSCPFISENDANCFALAEVLCGAGLEYYRQTKIPPSRQIAVGLILGSGFGGGVVVEGQLLVGKRGGGGEVGHVTLYPDGHPCYCGRRGCAEQYLCGPALEAALNNRIYSQINTRPSAAQIFELYKAQDPVAMAVVKQYKKDFAYYLGNLTNLFDPHYFVLGGGLSLQDSIYENLDEQICQNTFLAIEPIKVFKHTIADSAGAIGAILILIERANIKIV